MQPVDIRVRLAGPPPLIVPPPGRNRLGGHPVGAAGPGGRGGDEAMIRVDVEHQRAGGEGGGQGVGRPGTRSRRGKRASVSSREEGGAYQAGSLICSHLSGPEHDGVVAGRHVGDQLLVGEPDTEPRTGGGDGLEHFQAALERRLSRVFSQGMAGNQEFEAIQAALLSGRGGDTQVGDGRGVERARIGADRRHRWPT